MAVLALADRRWRRPAAVSGLTAAAFAACGALAARRAAGQAGLVMSGRAG